LGPEQRERTLSINNPWPHWNNPRITLYHGTVQTSAQAILRNGIDVACGNPNADFGPGFYTTTNRTQAQERSMFLAAVRTHAKPALVQLTIDRFALRELRSLVFVGETVDFWSFVATCRDSSIPNKVRTDYDVVYGPVAKKWFGVGKSAVHNGWDQISFHGASGSKLIQNERCCKVEVLN